MLLTELTELIVTQINSKQSLWTSDLTLVASAEIDWVSQLSIEGTKILVVPETNQYTITSENTRGTVKQLDTTKYISLLVGHTFTGLTQEDTAADWADAKLVSDLREKIEKVIIRSDFLQHNIQLVDVEAQPIDEQELDRRNFNAITSFGFQELECGSGPEYNSMQVELNDNTLQPETKASIRQRLSLGKTLGRR